MVFDSLQWVVSKPQLLTPNLDGVLYPVGAEAGSRRGTSRCLVEGSVRTLKNYFKSTCRV